MGTRGSYGFYKNGEDKLTYNHFDSYYGGLGSDIVKFLRSTTIDELNKIFDKIVMVNGESTPTPEQIKECKYFSDTNVSSGSLDEWYVLLRDTQGDLSAYKKDLKYMIDGKDFIKDSLFCEYAYIINLDTNEFEVYEGFQNSPQENRYYRDSSRNGYYNCALVKTFPLDNIPEDWIEEIPQSNEED